MDKDVLIRFVQFLETVFGRVNSKRLMVLLSFLLFLTYSKEVTELAVYLSTLATLLCLLCFQFDGKKSDSIEVTK